LALSAFLAGIALRRKNAETSDEPLSLPLFIQLCGHKGLSRDWPAGWQALGKTRAGQWCLSMVKDREGNGRRAATRTMDGRVLETADASEPRTPTVYYIHTMYKST